MSLINSASTSILKTRIVKGDIPVNFKKLRDEAIVPQYQKPWDSGFDFHAAVKENVYIPSGETVLIPTGWAVAVPEGFELQVRSRSGLALKNGCHVLNSPGTVDSSYRGEIGIIFHNTSLVVFVVTPGMRIAQGVICPVERASIEIVENLDETTRGEGGFGSTGV